MLFISNSRTRTIHLLGFSWNGRVRARQRAIWSLRVEGTRNGTIEGSEGVGEAIGFFTHCDMELLWTFERIADHAQTPSVDLLRRARDHATRQVLLQCVKPAPSFVIYLPWISTP